MLTEKRDEESYLSKLTNEAKHLDLISLHQVVESLNESGFRCFFQCKNELSLSTNIVDSIKINHQKKIVDISLIFTNFFGYSPVLHDFLTEKILHEKNQTFLEFLNLFYHRIFQILFENNKIQSQYFSMDLNIKMFSSLGGLSSSDDIEYLQYHSFFMNKYRSKKNFENFLFQFTGIIVRIQEFVGELLNFEDVYRMKLDGSSLLDGSLSLGSKYWCENSKIKIIFYPKTNENWERFLDIKKAKSLINLIDKFLNHTLNYEIVLFPYQIVQSKLVRKNNVRLGVNTFLCLNETKNINCFFKFIESV